MWTSASPCLLREHVGVPLKQVEQRAVAADPMYTFRKRQRGEQGSESPPHQK